MSDLQRLLEQVENARWGDRLDEPIRRALGADGRWPIGHISDSASVALSVARLLLPTHGNIAIDYRVDDAGVVWTCRMEVGGQDVVGSARRPPWAVIAATVRGLIAQTDSEN